mgnify:CR=1 FL=1
MQLVEGKNEMKWLEPIGHSFVIQDLKSLELWLGNYGSNAFENFTDYEMSCSIDMYAFKVDYKNYEVLVLGDEPMSMTFYQHGNIHYFVRWMFSPKDFEIEHHKIEISKLQSSSMIEPSFEINFATKNLVLHNSAYAGSEDPQIYEFKALSNNVMVDTYSYQPNEEINMIVHKFNYY